MKVSLEGVLNAVENLRRVLCKLPISPFGTKMTLKNISLRFWDLEERHWNLKLSDARIVNLSFSSTGKTVRGFHHE